MKINLLNKILSDIDNILDINCGGCCYIAYVIAKYCDTHNIPYYVVFTDNEDLFSNVDERIKSRSRTGIFDDGEYSCNHIYLNINNMNINFDTFMEYHYKSNSINSDDLLWIYKRGNWNDIYDKNNNSIISKFINKICEKTLKQNT